MSTDLYGIKVISKKEKEVTVKVIGIYYDESHCKLPNENSYKFFVGAFEECRGWVYSKGEIPKETIEETEDDFETEADFYGNYIEKIEIIEEKNYPISDDANYGDFYDYYEDKKEWEDEINLVQRVYKITVINKKFIKNVNPKMIWGTTSFEL